MVTNPNQKIITIVSEPHNESNKYGLISREAEYIAAHILNDGTASYILYVHFALHTNGYKFALSPVALRDELGLTEKQYRRAVKKLEQNGFLVKNSQTSNEFSFYELPAQYRGIRFLTESKVNIDNNSNDPESPSTPTGIDDIGDSRELSTPQGIEVYPYRDIPYPPQEAEGLPLQGERNNTENTEDITLDNTFNDTHSNSRLLDDSLFSPEVERMLMEIEDSFNGKGAFNDIAALDEEAEEGEELPRVPLEIKRARVPFLKYRAFNKFRYERITKGGPKSIIDKFLATHTESRALRQIGDKYGRFIRGWDETEQEPVILYSTSFVPSRLMRHDLTGIPEWYYRPELYMDEDDYSRFVDSNPDVNSQDDDDLPF